MAKHESLRRYTFHLPKSTGLQIEGLARARDKTMEDLVRQSLKIGLLVLQAESDPSVGRLLWEQDGETRELQIFGKQQVAPGQ